MTRWSVSCWRQTRSQYRKWNRYMRRARLHSRLADIIAARSLWWTWRAPPFGIAFVCRIGKHRSSWRVEAGRDGVRGMAIAVLV
jgi:hypothetical protein